MATRYRRAQHETPITEELRDLIIRRRAEIIELVYAALTDVNFLALRGKDTINIRAGITYNKYLGIVRASMVNEGRNLLTHWKEIKLESLIPWSTFYNEMSIVTWSSIASLLESAFYTTQRSGFDDLELQEHEGSWLPVASTAAGFGSVEPDDALLLLGLTGGRHPEEDHPRPVFVVNDLRFDASKEIITTAELDHQHGEYPVTYEKTSTFYNYVTVSSSGLISVSPNANASLGIISVEVKGIDGFGDIATAVISINIV